MAFVFEISLFFAAPQWRDVFVVIAQIGTPFQWFTNDDLLITSWCCLLLCQAILLKLRKGAVVHP